MFSEKMKAVRLQKGLSQEQLAQIVGITKSTISKYELGHREPSFEMIGRIASALDVSPFALIEDEFSTLETPAAPPELCEKSHYTFSYFESELVRFFSTLNNNGQMAALARVFELTEIPKYQRNDESENPPAK